MKASKAIIRCLEKEDADVLFGYPGAAVIPIYEELRKSEIKHILPRNEQSLVHYASGYARETGKVGVCIVTSGPGATNTVTGIATAYMDSIPIVIITGQVDTDLIGTDAFQEVDIKGATEPFTKHSYLVRNAEEIPTVFKEAFHIANTGRKGPVLIDIPKDVQEKDIVFDYPEEVAIIGYNPTFEGHKGQIKRALNKIKRSKKPVIYAGGGIIASGAEEELKAFSEKAGIPVINSLMGIGGYAQSSRYYAGIVGSHGYQYSKEVIARTDLLITIGARMSNRATAGFSKLNENIEFIHVDIDPAEIGKNRGFTLPIVGDAKYILNEFLEKEIDTDFSDWIDEINGLKEEDERYRSKRSQKNVLNPHDLIRTLSVNMKEDACLVADVGQNQIWSALNFEIKKDRSFFTSGGLGTMGYSLPAAIGVSIANPKRQVVSVVGDGGIQMCIGELAALREQETGVKIFILNNRKLNLVREIQQDVYGKGNSFGTDLHYQIRFDKLAEAYDIGFREVNDLESLDQITKEILNDPYPYIVQCNVSAEERTL